VWRSAARFAHLAAHEARRRAVSGRDARRGAESRLECGCNRRCVRRRVAL